MFDVGGGELLLIIFVVLLLFGPKKIPEFARMIKKGMSELKKAQSAFQEQVTNISEEITKPVNEIKDQIRFDEPVKQEMSKVVVNEESNSIIDDNAKSDNQVIVSDTKVNTNKNNVQAGEKNVKI